MKGLVFAFEKIQSFSNLGQQDPMLSPNGVENMDLDQIEEGQHGWSSLWQQNNWLERLRRVTCVIATGHPPAEGRWGNAQVVRSLCNAVSRKLPAVSSSSSLG